MVWRVNSAGVLDGKVAIVTGTSRGVGVGIAHELLRAGATVIGCSRSKLDAIPGVDGDEAWRQRSAQMVCDQGDFRAIDAFVSKVADTYGRIDILVNNAGGTVPTPHVEDVPALVQQIQGAPRADDDFERTVLFHSFAIQMNLISPLWFAIRVYRQMRGQDGVGSIINISSGTGHPAGSPTLVSYGAAKAGLNHLTRSLAEEWGPHARVNSLALGPTMTDNFRSFVLPKDDPKGEIVLPQRPAGPRRRARRGRPDVRVPVQRRGRLHQRHHDRDRRRHAARRAVRRGAEDDHGSPLRVNLLHRRR